MHLKTYKAHDLASALAAARAELGPDALVLATNEVRGAMGLATVEITVAIERTHQGAPPPDPRPRARCTPADRHASNAGTSGFSRVGRGADPAPSLRGASLALVRAGLSKDLAMRFARIAFARGGTHGISESVASEALAGIVRTAPVPRVRALFVVGPPGCGKTTTAAKLAARLSVESGRGVVLAQADADRIGALEQASIFARHLGLGLTPVRAARDLEALDRDTPAAASIVVDTAGVGSFDADRLALLRDLRRALPSAAVALVLPAGLHRDAARRVIERFAEIGPTFAVLSKVDDGARPGELLTALAPTNLPITLLSTGHRVPQDLEDASSARLASLLLRSGFHASEEASRAR
jgi:flagellar biosynthesis protein FlhF